MLDCDLHDFIEIACLYGFEINLKLSHQREVQGNAVTIQISPDKSEYLVLSVDGLTEEIDLTDISVMQAITVNPHFHIVEFQNKL